MKNPLAIFSKSNRQQDLKIRVLKNKEAVLDAMAENIKGARQCPFLLGQKCIGCLCEFFMEYKTVEDTTGKEFKYYRCSFVQIPMLLIEMNNNIRRLLK